MPCFTHQSAADSSGCCCNTQQGNFLFHSEEILKFKLFQRAVRLLWQAFLPPLCMKSLFFAIWSQHVFTDLFMGHMQIVLPRDPSHPRNICCPAVTTWWHCSFIVLLLGQVLQPETCTPFISSTFIAVWCDNETENYCILDPFPVRIYSVMFDHLLLFIRLPQVAVKGQSVPMCQYSLQVTSV